MLLNLSASLGHDDTVVRLRVNRCTKTQWPDSVTSNQKLYLQTTAQKTCPFKRRIAMTWEMEGALRD